MAKFNISSKLLEAIYLGLHPEEKSTNILLEEVTADINPPEGRILTSDEIKRRILAGKNTVFNTEHGTTIEITKEDKEDFLDAIEGITRNDAFSIGIEKGDINIDSQDPLAVYIYKKDKKRR